MVNLEENMTPVEILREQEKEQRKMIPKPIPASKSGTNVRRTRKEEKKLNGGIVSVNPNKRINWDEFKSLSVEHQKYYVSTILGRYPTLNYTDFAVFFGVKDSTIGKKFKALKLESIMTIKRGGLTLEHKAQAAAFYEAYGIESKQSSSVDTNSARNVFKISNIEFECNVDDIVAVAKQLGFTGKVRVHISAE